MKHIPVSEPVLFGNELKYVKDCIRSTWISGGPYVDRFERTFALFCGTKYATTVSNGTAALHLVLAALGVGVGDEVIVPDLTFVSTANVVAYTGARPIFADVDRKTWCLDPGDIEKRITPNTKAVIVVHLYGHPADMDRICAVARKHKLFVIEDACEAHGALYKGGKVGSLGTAAAFSFYGNKIITTGEGGMITTEDRKLLERINYLKAHALDKKHEYYHSEIGYNYRLTNLQAAFGVAQLEHIHEVIAIKRKNALDYGNLLKDIKGIELPPDEPWAKSVFWMYSILLPNRRIRDALMQKLAKAGIETRPFFIPIHALPMYRSKGHFPVTQDLSDRGMNLPSSAKLKRQDIEYICAQIKKYL